MAKKVWKTIVDVKNVQPHPALIPKKDPAFISLFKLAMSGDIPTYFTHIPLRLIRPFDERFLPQHRHPDGQMGVHIMTSLINQDKAPAVWVYPKDGVFVLSDDYHAYEAYRAEQVDYLPSYVMGDPAATGVKVIKGPLTVKGLRAAMGITIVRKSPAD